MASVHAPRTRCAVNAAKCVQRTRHDAVSHGTMEVHRQQGLHDDHPHNSSYKPQHQDLEKVAGQRVLNSEAVGAVATNGAKGGNGFQVEKGAPSSAS
jgi:hypothetical protein